MGVAGGFGLNLITLIACPRALHKMALKFLLFDLLARVVGIAISSCQMLVTTISPSSHTLAMFR